MELSELESPDSPRTEFAIDPRWGLLVLAPLAGATHGYGRAAAGAPLQLGHFALALLVIVAVLAATLQRSWLVRSLLVLGSLAAGLLALRLGSAAGSEHFRRRVLDSLDAYEASVAHSLGPAPSTIQHPHPDVAWASRSRDASGHEVVTFAPSPAPPGFLLYRTRGPLPPSPPERCLAEAKPGWYWPVDCATER